MLGLGNNLSLSPVLSGYTNSHHAEFVTASSQYIETNTTMEAILQDSFTIAFWTRLDDGSNNPPQCFMGVYAGPGELLLIAIGKNSSELDFSFTASGDQHISRSDAAVFVDGVNPWKHIAITFTKLGTGSGNGVQLMYVNGSLVASSIVNSKELTAANQGNLDLGASEMFIGAQNNQGTAALFVDGGMDEFAVWSTALHPTIIAEVAVAGADLLSVAATDLEHWYQLNDDVTDATGNSNGTNQGATFGTSVAT